MILFQASLLVACEPIDLGVTDNYPGPCDYSHCDYDNTSIGGPINIARDQPARLTVRTCVDARCSSQDFSVAPGATEAQADVSVQWRRDCEFDLLACAATRTWWVSWSRDVRHPDGRLVTTYRITIIERDTGSVLEDHTFTASYEAVKPQDCEYQILHDGGREDFTCTHFIAMWD